MGWGIYLSPAEKQFFAIARAKREKEEKENREMVGKVVFKSPTLGERGVGNLKGIRFEFMTQLEAIGIPEWMLDVDIQHFAKFLVETGLGEVDPLPSIWQTYCDWKDRGEW